MDYVGENGLCYGKRKASSLAGPDFYQDYYFSSREKKYIQYTYIAQSALSGGCGLAKW